MTKYMIKHKAAGESGEVIHFAGATGGDYTLCGHDMTGDEGWNEAVLTSKKVNCPQCIAIVEHVRKIKKTEIEIN